MEIYNCKVLVGGSRDNEVRKTYVTAPEIMMLKHLHGEDSVLEIAHVGTCKGLTQKQVREILAMGYAPDDNSPGGPAKMKEIFGPATAMLPNELEGVKLKAKTHDVPVELVTRWRAKVDEESEQQKEPLFAD